MWPLRHNRRKVEIGFGKRTTPAGLTNCWFEQQKILGQASRPISTGQLHPLPDFNFLPIYLVISEEPSVPITRKGDLILRQVSRLDAFSVYL